MSNLKGVLVGATALALSALFTPASSQTPAADGQVTKIDEPAGKITIKHGPIKNLDMDAMTMVFRVQDPAMLKQVKSGDKIKFDVDRVNGQLTVTRMQKVR